MFEGGCTMLKAKEALDKRNAKAQYPSYETSSLSQETSADYTETDEADTEDESVEAVAS